ncbi:hypothetical protein F66182_6507 [Fusarium sp. NRRL 66182]|nr:hypothetical protein F66182_6507 [Fusarium sp. NRRL 66182]
MAFLDAPSHGPEHKCPHCNYYPSHEIERLCEVCQHELGPKVSYTFLNGGERNWNIYHLVRGGDLPTRDLFEDTMRARLIREKRCRLLYCAKERVSPYVHCNSCREKLIARGFCDAAGVEEDTGPNSISTNPVEGLPKEPRTREHNGPEVPIQLNGWIWEDSLCRFVHYQGMVYNGNSSPEDMV